MLHSSLLAITALFLSVTTGASAIALPAAEAAFEHGISEEGHLFKRASPGPTDTTFINNVLTTVNPIRAKYKANPLAWDATLASFALTKSNGCKLNHTVGSVSPRGSLFLLFPLSHFSSRFPFSSCHVMSPNILFLPLSLNPSLPFPFFGPSLTAFPFPSPPDRAPTAKTPTGGGPSRQPPPPISAQPSPRLLPLGRRRPRSRRTRAATCWEADILRRRCGKHPQELGALLAPTGACRIRTRIGGSIASFGRGGIWLGLMRGMLVLFEGDGIGFVRRGGRREWRDGVWIGGMRVRNGQF